MSPKHLLRATLAKTFYKHPMELAIVMPAYNEEGCIVPVLQSWLGEAQKHTSDCHIFVVNDGSRDKTGEILDQFAKSEPRLTVIHQKNAGHGQALLRAYHAAIAASPAWIFHVDSDNQFDPADFEKLWSARNNSKFLSGFRQVRHDATVRLFITRILRILTILFFGRYIPDTNIPFRLISTNYLKLLLAQFPATVFAPNIFLTVLAARDGQNILQVPVTHRDRRTGKVSLVKLSLIKACLRCVKELYEFRKSLPQALENLKDASTT